MSKEWHIHHEDELEDLGARLEDIFGAMMESDSNGTAELSFEFERMRIADTYFGGDNRKAQLAIGEATERRLGEIIRQSLPNIDEGKA